jgi:hypothetical protein
MNKVIHEWLHSFKGQLKVNETYYPMGLTIRIDYIGKTLISYTIL